MRELFM